MTMRTLVDTPCKGCSHYQYRNGDHYCHSFKWGINPYQIKSCSARYAGTVVN